MHAFHWLLWTDVDITLYSSIKKKVKRTYPLLSPETMIFDSKTHSKGTSCSITFMLPTLLSW